MRTSGAILALAVTAAGAHAQTRPSTVDVPCNVSRQLVFSRGAVVLGTGGFSYDRFVRDRTFCEFNEYLEPAFVPGLDTPQCFVGYRCKAGPKDWWSGSLPRRAPVATTPASASAATPVSASRP